MDDFRKEVIKELEKKLGDGYEILPYNRVRNNKIVLHGVCIHNKDKTVCPVMYLDEYILPYAAGAMNPEGIAGKLLEEYFEDGIPQDIVEHVEDFNLMKGKVRVKVINYDANTKKLEQIPHRKFLDLAIAYYLDMEVKLREGNMTIGITNELMEKWGVSEEELYRLGMENLSAKDSFSASELIGIIRKMAQTGLDERSEKLLEEIEKEDGPDAELYVASNRKHLFGACCMLAEEIDLIKIMKVTGLTEAELLRLQEKV